jgi:hypothetical protein
MELEVTNDPEVIMGIFCGRGGAAKGIIGDLRSTLLCQGRRADTVARSLGFVNAEHQALAFLASPMFRVIIMAILASRRVRDDGPSRCTTWVDYANALLQQRYGWKVVMDSEKKILEASPPLRRRGTKPHDCQEHPPIGGNGQGEMTVLQILEQYDEVIRKEQLRARLPKELRDEHVRATGNDDPVYSTRPRRR